MENASNIIIVAVGMTFMGVIDGMMMIMMMMITKFKRKTHAYRIFVPLEPNNLSFSPCNSNKHILSSKI